MKNNYIVGDIIKALKNSDIDMLVHGCNCFCGFGRGLASYIDKAFPEALKADKETIPGDKNKLGSYSIAEVLPNRYVLNAYVQYHWIKGLNNEPKILKYEKKVPLLANYKAIDNVTKKIANDFKKDITIGFPKIGAGYANGDWKTIEAIIKQNLIEKGFNVIIYVLSEEEIIP